MAISLFLVFISSITISYTFVPFIINLGRKLSILDNPDVRKKHSKPLVRLGGISIYLGFIIPISIIIFVNLYENETLSHLNIFLISSFLFFLLGILEDIFNLSFLLKLLSQIIIASYIWSCGITLDFIKLPIFEFISDTNLYSQLSYLTTVFFIVAIVNAFNWVDGLDGLASGLAIISCLGYFLILIQTDQNFYSLAILMSIIGTNLGFLKHNFFPSKIFMGDGGSFFLGSLIAFLSLNQNIFLSFYQSNSSLLLAKFLVIGLPLFDMIYVIFKRILKKKSPFHPDRNHFHHRLIDSGLNHKQTVLICYLIQISFVSLGLFF